MLDPVHPTLYLASDLDVGWTVLHYRGGSAEVASVERSDDLITVHFVNGAPDSWGPQDRVHATPLT
jgi:hypothetical protein